MNEKEFINKFIAEYLKAYGGQVGVCTFKDGKKESYVCAQEGSSYDISMHNMLRFYKANDD